MTSILGRRQRSNLYDRASFHKALIEALADPYSEGGRDTKKRITPTLAEGYDSKEQSRVLDARFALGLQNESYLSAPVLPLQPVASDESSELGLALDPELEAAQRRGMLMAIQAQLEAKTAEAISAAESSMRLLGYLLTIPEVSDFCAQVLTATKKVRLGAGSSTDPDSMGEPAQLAELALESVSYTHLTLPTKA